MLALSFLIGAVFTVNFALKTQAASYAAGDLEVQYDGSGALFSASNIAPGYQEVKTLTVINHGTVSHSFSIAISGTVGTLGNVMQFEPRDFITNFPIWNHTLAEISALPDGFVVLSSIMSGQTIKFNLTVILPSTVGNDYQDKSIETFGIIVGSDSSFAYNPTVIPVFGPSESGTSTDQNVTSSQNRAGARRTTTGKTARGLALGTEGVGQETPLIAENSPAKTGEVLGTTAEETKGGSTENKSICFWWWVLSIVYAVLLLIYGWIFYKRELMFDWAGPVLGGAFFYFLHWYLHLYYTPSKWCNYFVWIESAEFIIYLIIYSHFKNRISKK